MDQRQKLSVEFSDVSSPEMPESICALDFVRDAVQKWANVNGGHALSVPAVTAFLLLQLVRDPTTVKMYITTSVRSVTIEFEVEEADKGRIIGKGGHTIDAIRSLARSVAGATTRDYQIYLIKDRYRP